MRSHTFISICTTGSESREREREREKEREREDGIKNSLN